MTWHLQCTVNGSPLQHDVPEERTLLSWLRDDLGLTGTKGACLEGECGSCTVLLDDEPVCSCLVLAPQVHGRRVTTVEGVARGDRLSALQEAFLDTGAAPCGYCTPGLIMSAQAMLNRTPRPDDRELCVGIEGNLCRCTGYTSVVEAIRRTARENDR